MLRDRLKEPLLKKIDNTRNLFTPSIYLTIYLNYTLIMLPLSESLESAPSVRYHRVRKMFSTSQKREADRGKIARQDVSWYMHIIPLS